MLNALLESTETFNRTILQTIFADYFPGKVAAMRASSAGAPPPSIRPRLVPLLGCLNNVTLREMVKAIQKAPSKQCHPGGGGKGYPESTLKAMSSWRRWQRLSRKHPQSNVILEEVAKAIQKAPSKQCDPNPVPTWLVKECGDILGPVLT